MNATMKFSGTTGEYFEIQERQPDGHIHNEPVENQLSMLWFKGNDNKMEIDSKEYIFNKNEILFLTPFNKIKVHKTCDHRYMRFNKPFYCILDHDSEVGCRGILFYGTNSIPTLQPSEQDLAILETVWKMLVIEMKSNDNLQQEMLQMMLKRILILCTRIYKSQANFSAIETSQVDIIRDFNFLVEQHFKEKHTVTEYATLLNKSPKTLSNLFKKLNSKTPLQMIQERIMLEARRLLRYSDKPISEVGYDVGFSDIQSFSRFFKKHQGVSPTEFRTN